MVDDQRKATQTGLNNQYMSDEERNTKLEFGSSDAKSTIDTRPANFKSFNFGQTLSKMTNPRTLDLVFSSNKVSNLSH